MRPDLSRVPSFYHNYINQVAQEDLLEAFNAGTPAFIQFLENIPLLKREYRYAEGKWTIKDVLQHIIDAERVFAYRGLRFARRDTTSLPGFDEKISDNDGSHFICRAKTNCKTSVMAMAIYRIRVLRISLNWVWFPGNQS